MSEERSLSALDESKSSKNFNYEGLNKIRKDFDKLRHTFSKPEIKEIGKNVHEIKNKRIILNQK